ncbi:MAG: flagellar motor switch protein FliG [Candidatus Nucleicultricaceae bacterium]
MARDKDKAEKEEKVAGLEKAAIFMLSLPKTTVGKILAKFSEEEIRDLSHKMANLGNIKAKTVNAIFQDFFMKISKSNTEVIGTIESTERLLSSIYDDRKVREIMADIKGPAGRTMWDKLANVNEEFLANYLKNEHPQIVALILTKVRPSHSANIFARLPEDFSVDVMFRMLNMETVSSDILENVEKTLRNEFMTNLSNASRENPHELIAEVFNFFDRNTETRFMMALENKDNDSAEKVRSLMFTFDDLLHLDASAIQTLIRLTDKAKLPLALKGTNEEVKELFFKNMSERAAKLLKEDMESLGMVRLKMVDEAQQEIVNLAKNLAAKGEIVISRGGGDGDELVG